jgi:SAM-dependent methyltransferase
MNTFSEGPIITSFEHMYEYEASLNESIGAKERFILLSKYAGKIISQPNVIKILDGGGTTVTSYVLKKIFPGSFVVSVNLEGKNDIADVSIEGSLSDYKKIIELSRIEEFDIIFLGEVFEHLFSPYNIIKNLITLIKPSGYLIVTTPNLADIYNRLLLLLGQPLHNYRTIGSSPNQDHVTLVTKNQMLNLLRKNLVLDVMDLDGYSYLKRKIIVEEENKEAQSGRRLRFVRAIVNKVVPINFKEGIFYLAKKISY